MYVRTDMNKKKERTSGANGHSSNALTITLKSSNVNRRIVFVKSSCSLFGFEGSAMTFSKWLAPGPNELLLTNKSLLTYNSADY